MNDNHQFRRYFTDAEYRREIEERVKNELKWEKNWASKPYEKEDEDESNFPYPSPYIDQADVIARVVISDMRKYGRGTDDIIGNLDLEMQTEMKDVAAEIIRQGIGGNAYERINVSHTDTNYKTSYQIEQDFKNNDAEFYRVADGEGYSTLEIRAQLFDQFLGAALHHGTDENFTPVERCMRTVRSVIGIIDGENGNGPDGNGLPLFQIIPSPHPDYAQARVRHDLPAYPNDVPINIGLISTETSTGLGPAFEQRFDHFFAKAVGERMIRSAKELFGQPSDGYDEYRKK